MSAVDYSTVSIAIRIRRVSQLRNLCLSLAKAKAPEVEERKSEERRAGGGSNMKMDMTALAITTRLKRVSQLREAWLRLAKGPLAPPETTTRKAPNAPQDGTSRGNGT